MNRATTQARNPNKIIAPVHCGLALPRTAATSSVGTPVFTHTAGSASGLLTVVLTWTLGIATA
jgi:hypothetical protein